jgi:macrolide-specific efflux system membrane fusion protein
MKILGAKRWILFTLLAALILGGGGYTLWRKKSSAAPVYRQEKAVRGDISLSILSTGTVQPQNRLEIKAPTAGRIETVLVKEGQNVKRGQILAWMSSTERAALLDAARSKGEDEVKRWEEMYRPTPIIAPINGTLILRSVEPGQTFSTTDPILVMSDRLTVKAQVDETDIAQIRLKMGAEITLDAYSKEKIAARVDQIAFEAKTVNNVTTYLVDVLPIKTPEFMRSGMTANVTFSIEEKKDILLIPNEAIRMDPDGPKVLIRRADGHPVEQKIETGMSDGKQTEIISGVLEGETLLIVTVSSSGSRSGSNPLNPMGGRRPPRR